MQGQILSSDTALRYSQDIWNTVGVSENIIEASRRALADSIHLKPSTDLPE